MQNSSDYSYKDLGNDSWLVVGGLDEINDGLTQCKKMLTSAEDMPVSNIADGVRPQYDAEASQFVIRQAAVPLLEQVKQSVWSLMSWNVPAAIPLSNSGLTLSKVVTDLLNPDLNKAESRLIKNLGCIESFANVAKDIEEGAEIKIIQDLQSKLSDLWALSQKKDSFASLKNAYCQATQGYLVQKNIQIKGDDHVCIAQQVEEKVNLFSKDIIAQIQVTQKCLERRMGELTKQPYKEEYQVTQEIMVVNVEPQAPPLQEASKIVENAEIVVDHQPIASQEGLYRDLTPGERRLTFPKFKFNGELLISILNNLSFDGCYAMMCYTHGFVLQSRGKGFPLPLKDANVKLLAGTQINGTPLLTALTQMDSSQRELMSLFITAHYKELQRQRNG